MSNIYQVRDIVKISFIVVSLLLVSLFLYISHSLIKSLEAEERSKMEIWAEATRQLASNDMETDMSLVLKVIQSNTTIPVVILDDQDQLLWDINFTINTQDTVSYLQNKVTELKQKGNLIVVDISEDVKQYLYYDDSVLLKQLSYYPYIQLFILLLFIMIAFFAFSSTKKAEQNQVWVGLSKETAHQLGTPISSLMAWIEYLRNGQATEEVVDEMDKDVTRLSMIAERFSKIGSQPKLDLVDMRSIAEQAIGYMKSRVSSKTHLLLENSNKPLPIEASEPLFNWVFENLCKNSMDAIVGNGEIRIKVFEEGSNCIVEIQDNGKGIPKNRFKTIFHPGYTTKKRGWGLGLTLVKRIVEQYHHGRIFVKESIPNTRTTMRMEIPLK